MRFSSRYPPELVRFVERLSERELSAAEIHRAVGDRAAELGVPRPSYERTRQLVFGSRIRSPEPSWGEVLLDVDLRIRPPDAILDKLAGTWPLDEDAGLRRTRKPPRRA